MQVRVIGPLQGHPVTLKLRHHLVPPSIIPLAYFSAVPTLPEGLSRQERGADPAWPLHAATRCVMP